MAYDTASLSEGVVPPKPQPQPPPRIDKTETPAMKQELELNRSRLAFTREKMRGMKEQINKCADILRREMGDGVDVQSMARTGWGPGYQTRVREIIQLRMRLSALKSQFSEPVVKCYYRGPFDPRKRFDVGMIPEKRNTLFGQLLEEEKQGRLLNHDAPLETLAAQKKELSLMYRASCYRTKSLNKKIKATELALNRIRAETRERAKVIEYMISHQSLMKMMLNPATLKLDASLIMNEHQTGDESPEDEASDLYRFKTLNGQSEKEVGVFQEQVSSLAKQLDANVACLVEIEEVSTRHRCDIERLKKPEPQKSAVKGKSKVAAVQLNGGEVPSNDLDRLKEENRHVRAFLTSPMFSNQEDLRLFLISIESTKTEFMNSINGIKANINAAYKNGRTME